MFAILLSTLWTAFSFLLRTVVIKFFIFTAMFVLLTELLPMVTRLMGLQGFTGALTGSLASIPSSVWFFLNSFRFDFGLPLILSAYASRFVIRRLPLVG
nr:DUF2523 family protein [uncultured Undibacterium sp.]